MICFEKYFSKVESMEKSDQIGIHSVSFHAGCWFAAVIVTGGAGILVVRLDEAFDEKSGVGKGGIETWPTGFQKGYSIDNI